jgi:hypothetical protein
MTATIASKNDNWVLTIPKQLLSDEYVKRLIERIEYLNLVDESKLSSEDAWNLSEEIKESWWKANRERMLAKLQNG